MSVKLGWLVKDSHCGFTGYAVARTEYIFGCARILVEPNKTKENGELIDSVWYDEQQLEVIKKSKPVNNHKKTPPGGPGKKSKRRPDATK